MVLMSQSYAVVLFCFSLLIITVILLARDDSPSEDERTEAWRVQPDFSPVCPTFRSWKILGIWGILVMVRMGKLSQKLM